MSNRFHLAIPAGDLEKTIPFYTDILGCELGPKEENKWQDIDFWGNELTLHITVLRTQREDDRNRERHEVDMGTVCVPHFGIHLEKDKFQFVKKQIEKTISFLITHMLGLQEKIQSKKLFHRRPKLQRIRNQNSIKNRLK